MSDITIEANQLSAPRLATFAAELQTDVLPDAVSEAAKLHLLDTLGCGLAARAVGVGTAAVEALPPLAAPGAAAVIGCPESVAAPTAAFANAMLCHGLDFDDTHGGSIAHVGVVVGPAALAAAQAAHASGDALVAALVAGTEIVARVGAVAAPSYMTRGFHPTSVCGVVGATAAVAPVSGTDATVAAQALGLAGSMASGIFAYLSDGSETKPVHAGVAAQNAVVAVALAQAGATGPAAVLEDRFGLLAAYFERDLDALERELGDLGSRWETSATAYKRYPACHFIHGALDAGAALRERVPADEIEEVVVGVPAPAVPLVLEPLDAKTAPRTPYDAKFSLQYSLAAMLVHGRVNVATYSEQALTDERVLALAARVRHEVRTFASYPAAFPGAVRIVSRDGAVHELEVPFQRGAPENPLDADEVVAKFRANASLALDDDSAARLEAEVLSLEQLPDVSACFGALRKATAR